MTYSDFQSEIENEANHMQAETLLALWNRLERFGSGDVVQRYTSLITVYVSLKRAIHRINKKLREFNPYDADYKYFVSLRAQKNHLEDQVDTLILQKHWLRTEMTHQGIDYKRFHKWIQT